MRSFNDSPEFNCKQCGVKSTLNNLFVSPNCFVRGKTDHYYCTGCASKIINESLSLLNETPKCIIRNCNKSFNISFSKAINKKLFTRYKTKRKKVKQYKNDELLLHGYIRQHKNNNNSFPTDIIQLVHDFYKLSFLTALPCENCNSKGLQKCNKCNGDGTYTSQCTSCKDGIIYKPVDNCPYCLKGKQHIMVKCNCFMNYYAVCSSCDGFGTNKGLICSSCNGSGEICPNNCNNGYFITVIDCDYCKGLGEIYTMLSCDLCDGKKYYSDVCCECKGMGNATECDQCETLGGIFYTDFNKVISRQTYCYLCGKYYPNNMIIYWSGCRHTFCNTCIFQSDYIEIEMYCESKIPVCPVDDCNQELSEECMQLMYTYYNYDSDTIDGLIYTLSFLKYSNTKFECYLCECWHPNEHMIELSECGCKCSKECCKILIETYVSDGTIALCDCCGDEIDMNDIELICGKFYVHLTETLIYNKRLEELITRKRTKIKHKDTRRVLKIRNADLNYNDIKLSDKIIHFLNLTSINISDIEYLNIIPTKGQIPLFQLFLKDEQIAENIYFEILNLIQENVMYDKWHIAFWEIHNQSYNERQYNYLGEYVTPYRQQVRKYKVRNSSTRNNYYYSNKYYRNNNRNTYRGNYKYFRNRNQYY